MKVKLLETIEQGGHLKVSKRRNPAWTPGGNEPEYRYITFTQGAVVEVSDETGKKWVSEKKAKEVK